MPKKKSAPKPSKSFEESLWETATKLRGSVESSEYKHVVLSLIFLKFVSDKFEERRAQLIAEGQEAYVDMVEFYTMQNVFYLPETSRWSYIQQHAKQDDIAIKIDSALTAVEKSNASLKGALPDNYFSRLGLDGSKLAALIDAINNIDTVEDKEEDTVGRVYEYFLGKFAASEGKLGGEFYTPKCVVNLIAEMIEPYKGKIYDIAAIAKTYHAWRGEAKDGAYEDVAGYCKSANLEDMRKHDYVLTPGRYVGAAAIEDDGIPFETKMIEMSQTLYAQMAESEKLDTVIQKNLEGLGYGQ